MWHPSVPPDDDPVEQGCGQSFTAATKVLLATGAPIPISQMKPGDKVLATNTTTGTPQTVTAVMEKHDTNRYNLTIRSGPHTAIINTTRNHLFWDTSLNKFLPASNLKPGTHLKTPDGQAAIVVGSSTPAVHDGWMWDLTVQDDHDFYIDIATTAVLVHNCTSPNQMQRQVLRGQAPNGIERVDTANPGTDDAQPHIHFSDWRSTLNQDGTWGHGDGSDANLTSNMISWILSNGWGVPGE
jgi:Pretoxin HINT domain